MYLKQPETHLAGWLFSWQTPSFVCQPSLSQEGSPFGYPGDKDFSEVYIPGHSRGFPKLKWWHSHRTGLRRYTGDDVCSTIKSGISCQHLELMGGITNQNHSWPLFSGASPPGNWRFSAGTAQDFFTRAIRLPEFQNWAWAKRKKPGWLPWNKCPTGFFRVSRQKG